MTNQKTTKVFVYGSLLSGLINSALLDSSKKLGDFVTPPKFKMFDLGMFPAIIPGGDTPIKGEVYEVAGTTLERLDQLEGHPHFYRRTKIATEYGEAWVYLFQTDLRDSTRVPDGDWRSYRDAF